MDGSDVSMMTQSAFGSRHLEALAARRTATADALRALAVASPGEMAERVGVLERDLSSFSAVVTIVGQVKAGKTALANALAGTPGLLPMDVNPWTSVVTSLHLNSAGDRKNSAVFEFFDRAEWETLVTGGGRFGEMARQARADAELAELEAQIEAVYAKAKARLGADFERLLGGRHDFETFDAGLVERYVCLGDDEPAAPDGAAGHFADLTKSADLYFDAGQYAVPLTVRDTPGVNDPFLVREQMTLRCLADTHICLVVLSAHQALTSTDIALIRILSSMRHEQIVLFVNRIDELNDPAREIPEIEKRVRRTLKVLKMPPRLSVVFGSALWAGAAQGRDLDALPDHSSDALAALIASEPAGTFGSGAQSQAWSASGLPDLQAALAGRIEAGIGARALTTAAGGGLNLARQSHSLISTADRFMRESVEINLDQDALGQRLDQLVTAHNHAIETLIDRAIPMLSRTMRDTVDHFANRECAELSATLSASRKKGRWSVDTASLRRDLNREYFAFATKMQKRTAAQFEKMAEDLLQLYKDLLGTSAYGMAVSPPQAPLVTAPIALSTALTFDMNMPWWNAMFGLKSGVETKAKKLRRLIERETREILVPIEQDNMLKLAVETRAILRNFLDEHSATLNDLVSLTDPDALARVTERLGLTGGAGHPIEELTRIVGVFEDLVAEDEASAEDLRLVKA